MRELSKEDILRNNVDTISQYHILEYLKKNLNLDEFKIYLVNRDNMKVIDKEENCLYFHYNSKNKEVTYQDERIEKEHEFEVGL